MVEEQAQSQELSSQEKMTSPQNPRWWVYRLYPALSFTRPCLPALSFRLHLWASVQFKAASVLLNQHLHGNSICIFRNQRISRQRNWRFELFGGFILLCKSTMGDHNIGFDVEDTPRIGMMFDSEENAYDFYLAYGRSMGFNIRREYCRWRKAKDKTKTVLTSRRFVCNKYGLRRKDKRDIYTKKPRAETRTDCPARMGIQYINKEGRYQCFDFVEDHNHLLHLPATLHYMRSQRKISNVHSVQIDLADASGIKPKVTIDYMDRQAGGGQNHGYARQDLNYLPTKRQRDIAYGETGSMLKYFSQCPTFFNSIQFDIDERMTNFFWVDHRMRIDYALFGDVITFVTTFCTNKECRPFGVFVGFNHHRGVVIFGAVLLYDQTVESFKWLFEAFLKAHGQKKPITMFTDQDAAMAKAISQVFPSTWHGLCPWHIMQNGIKHLGNLMKNESDFLREFKACMFHYEEEADFEKAWEKLITEYPTTEDSWLCNIYGLKEKWAKCYMKKTLTIGMKDIQLSESLNEDLKDYLRSSLDVVQFLKHFERVVNNKRESELKTEFDARNKLPRNMFPKCPLMKQAEEIYTPLIFEKLHEEYAMVSACYIKYRNESSDLHEFVVAIFDEVGDFKVLSKPSEPMIECSCRKYETFGILCCHAIKILEQVEDIKLIPEAYILRRWTRTARNIIVEDSKKTKLKKTFIWIAQNVTGFFTLN
ncbi:hypothetical protein NE237_029252 [Protea cynaroides]|uniref:SWIM-type domain-containing protein n=1 Tax=Protea cynaroides TaxID=273540 RepID=A0A9Q0GTY6_9MAGN|nr:hypothetical protein NE237_029252 [Protea cynaroides]